MDADNIVGAGPWITCTSDVIYAGQGLDAPVYALTISQPDPSGPAVLRYRGFDEVESAQRYLMNIVHQAGVPGSSVKETIHLICFSERPDDHISFGFLVRLIHPAWINDAGNVSNGMSSLRKFGGRVDQPDTRPALAHTAGPVPNLTYAKHAPGLVASFFAYYTGNQTTIGLMQVMTGAMGSIYLLHELIKPTVPLHIPGISSHPLTAVMFVISRLINFKKETSNTIAIEKVLRSAGLHNYTNWERNDAMELPPHELVGFTASMVATSTGLLARTGELRSLVDALKYLQEENKAMKQWCDATGKSLAHQQIDEWADYLQLQAKNVQVYEESLAATASVVVQGLQNIIGQKNQEETRRIAEESKRLAEESRKIAEASWRDTTSVTAVTLITMVFLPATFMATLFSTDFVKDGGFGQNYMNQARVYIGVTIPLTAIVVVCWFLYTNVKRRREEARLKRRHTLEMEREKVS